MIRKLYKKENNIFQSPEWANFQKSFGREVIVFDNFLGIKLGLPFGKSFAWVQKGPMGKLQIPNNKSQIGKDVVFVRVEPEESPGKEYIAVTGRSLLSGQQSPKATLVLDITKSEEELLSKMKPKTRYNIRLAVKKGVRVTESTDVDKFYKMLISTCAKDKGYFPHEKGYYAKMMEELGPKGLAKIFLAEYEGKVLAAVLITFYGEVATYLHGGSSTENKEVMAPYLCHWEAIKFAKKNGQKYYDFWGVSPNDEQSDPWFGITRFKTGFGGEKVIFAGDYDLILNKFWYNVLALGAKLRRIFK